VSQLPQLEWPVAHALGALDWSPKPPLEEAATWESRRWSPYEAESARALQVCLKYHKGMCASIFEDSILQVNFFSGADLR